MKPYCPVVLALLLAVLSASAQSPSAAATPGSPASAAPAAAAAAPSTGKADLLHLPPSTDPGARQAGQLLEQMVAALGGQAYLTIQDIEQEGRTYGFDSQGRADGEGAPFARFCRWPDQERLELTQKRDWADIGGIPFPITPKGQDIILYSGNQGYEIDYKGATALDQDILQDYQRRRVHSLPWVLRKWLTEPGIVILYEGHVLVERKQADQISLITAQNDAVTIAIDSISHLPVRVSFTWRDPKYRDKNEEAEAYDNYKPVQGIMTPLSTIRYYNGLPRNQRFVTSTKYNQSLPDSLFSIKNLPPPPKGKKK